MQTYHILEGQFFECKETICNRFHVQFVLSIFEVVTQSS